MRKRICKLPAGGRRDWKLGGDSWRPYAKYSSAQQTVWKTRKAFFYEAILHPFNLGGEWGVQTFNVTLRTFLNLFLGSWGTAAPIRASVRPTVRPCVHPPVRP